MVGPEVTELIQAMHCTNVRSDRLNGNDFSASTLSEAMHESVLDL